MIITLLILIDSFKNTKYSQMNFGNLCIYSKTLWIKYDRSICFKKNITTNYLHRLFKLFWICYKNRVYRFINFLLKLLKFFFWSIKKKLDLKYASDVIDGLLKVLFNIILLKKFFALLNQFLLFNKVTRLNIKKKLAARLISRYWFTQITMLLVITMFNWLPTTVQPQTHQVHSPFSEPY